jgi:hypothetical protein
MLANFDFVRDLPSASVGLGDLHSQVMLPICVHGAG